MMPTETLLRFAGYSRDMARLTLEQGGTALFAAIRRACATVGYGVTAALKAAKEALASIERTAWKAHVAWCEATAKAPSIPPVKVGIAPAPTVCMPARRRIRTSEARCGSGHRVSTPYPLHGRPA